MILICVIWVSMTPFFMDLDKELSVGYYIITLIIFAFNGCSMVVGYVSAMVLFAKICDPIIGGTYITLLNTITNLGSAWPGTLALYLVSFTPKYCTLENFHPSPNMTVYETYNVTNYLKVIEDNHCRSKIDIDVDKFIFFLK
jgi:hypothetical protein